MTQQYQRRVSVYPFFCPKSTLPIRVKTTFVYGNQPIKFCTFPARWLIDFRKYTVDRILGPIGFIVLIGFGIAQIVAGFVGIQDGLGTVWAVIALIVALLARFMLPLTIGAFFGAMNVWDWHWAAALLFAAPGLLLLVPGILATITSRSR